MLFKRISNAVEYLTKDIKTGLGTFISIAVTPTQVQNVVQYLSVVAGIQWVLM